MLKLSQRFKVPRRDEEAEDTRVSFGDVVSLFRRNFRFFGLSALVLSVVAVVVALLIPQQYEKRVDLSVRQVPGVLPERVEVDKTSTDSLGNSAVRYVQGGDLDDVAVSPRYDRATQQVELSLRSPDPEALDGVGSEVVDLLKARFQESSESQLGAPLEARQEQLTRDLEQRQEILARIEQQIEQASSDETARREGLEVQRATRLGDVDEGQVQLEAVEQLQENLPQLAAEIISVEILDETEARQASSPGSMIALAVLFGLVAAALLTIVWGAIVRKKPRG